MASGNKRIQKDLSNLIEAGFAVKMFREDDMHVFSVMFHGPENSPYHGYVWKTTVMLPDDYPDRPPDVFFVDKIYHPNIHFHKGFLCVNLLEEPFWSNSNSDLVFVFQTILPELLKQPNPKDPINHLAAELLLNNPEQYEAKVKEHCAAHATEEAGNNETDEDEIEEINEEEIEEVNEAGAVSEITEQTGMLSIEEEKDDNVSEDENVSEKADDP